MFSWLHIWTDILCDMLIFPFLVVSMPCDQYSLELTNITVATFNKQLSRVTGMIIGDTELILHDKSEYMFNIEV